MSFLIGCPTCAGKLEVSDDLSGQTIKCPKCAALMTVPEHDETVTHVGTRAGRRRDSYSDLGYGSPYPQGNGMAIAGMVLGIVGFVLSFIPCLGWFLAIILGIIGAVFSGVGLANASHRGAGRGMAIAGLVLSTLAILWVPLFWLLLLPALGPAGLGALRF